MQLDGFLFRCSRALSTLTSTRLSKFSVTRIFAFENMYSEGQFRSTAPRWSLTTRVYRFMPPGSQDIQPGVDPRNMSNSHRLALSGGETPGAQMHRGSVFHQSAECPLEDTPAVTTGRQRGQNDKNDSSHHHHHHHHPTGPTPSVPNPGDMTSTSRHLRSTPRR